MPNENNPDLVNAMTYIYSVQKIFKDDQEVYKEFVKIMKAFKSKEIQWFEVSPRIEKLFEGHPELIRQFRQFMPTDSCNLTSPLMTPPQSNKKLQSLISKPSKDELAREYTKIIERDRKLLFQHALFSCEFTAQNTLPHITSAINKPRLLSAKTDRGTIFLSMMAAVKTALRYPSDYAFILKAINLYNNGIVKEDQLVRLVEPKLSFSGECSHLFAKFCQCFQVSVPVAPSSLPSGSDSRPRLSPSYVLVKEEENRLEQARLRKFMSPKLVHLVDVLNTQTMLAERGKGPVPDSVRAGSSPGRKVIARESDMFRWENVCQDLTEQEETLDMIHICLQQTQSLLRALSSQRKALGDDRASDIFDSFSDVQ